jgi:hypothetical protein
LERKLRNTGFEKAFRDYLLAQMQHIPRPKRKHLDIGSGNGEFACMLADMLGSDHLTMVDKYNLRSVELTATRTYAVCDLMSPEFLRRYQHQYAIISVIAAFHEFDNPWGAIQQMMYTLPWNAVLFVIDSNQNGWQQREDNKLDLNPAMLRHYEEDRVRLRQTGFDTDANIEAFWRNHVGQAYPGKARFHNLDNVYCAVYHATPP